jgi:hypothetical protein
MLKPGELQEATDVVYRVNDPAARKAPGRTTFGSTVGGGPRPQQTDLSIRGIHHCAFDDSQGVLLFRDTDKIFEADEGETGSPQEITQAPGERVRIDQNTVAAQHSNKFFLFDGVNENQVATKLLTGDEDTGSRSLRVHGLKPTTRWWAIEVTSAGAAWNLSLDVYYWYWVTEYDSVNDLESDVDLDQGRMKPVKVTASSNKAVQISYYDRKNPSADKWRIYRSTVITDTDDREDAPALSDGVLIATVDADNSTYTFADDAISEGPKNPTANEAGQGGPFGRTWASRDNAHADDGTYATATQVNARAKWKDFGFSTLEDNITGIEVKIEAKADSDESAELNVYLEINGTTAGGDRKRSGYLGSKVFDVYEFGGYGDLWGFAQTEATTTNLEDAEFAVWVEALQVDELIEIDYIEVTVWYSGENRSGEGTAFPAIVLQVGNITSVFGQNGEPPSASVGDIFEDSLVTNDISDKSIIRYSYPGNPDAFPSPYYVSMETKDKDEVTAITSRQDRLIVGLKRHVARVDYLPSETDLGFSRGRCWSIVSSDHGIVGPTAATLVKPDSRATLVAFIDRYQGLCVTDGYSIRNVSKGIDFVSMVNPGMLHRCTLMNYPPNKCIILYYADAGSTTVDKRLFFYYDEVQQGEFRVTGPCHLPNGGAAGMMRVGDQATHLYGDNGGKIWVEDRGFDGGDVPILSRIRTREMYEAGIGNDVMLNHIYMHYRFAGRPGGGSTGFIGVDTWEYNTDKPPIRIPRQFKPVAQRGHIRFNYESSEAEGYMFDIGFTDDGSEMAVDHITLARASAGSED